MDTSRNRKVTRRELVRSGGIIAASLTLDGGLPTISSSEPTGEPRVVNEQTMAVTGISSIWFGVTDWQRAKNFYEKVLGLRSTFVNNETGVAAYSANMTDPPIFLIKRHVDSSKRRPKPASGENRGGTVGFNVADAAEIMKHVVTFGGSVSDHVQDGVDTRVFTIYDPDGNVLELTEMKTVR